MDVGQPVAAALELEGQTFVVDPQQLQQGGVQVVDVQTGQITKSRDVRIQDGRIAEIVVSGPREPVEGATFVDGGGGWLIPALAEMHAHVPSASQGQQRMKAQLEQMTARRSALREQLEGSNEPLQQQQETLENQLQSRLVIENELSDARKALETIDSELRAKEQQRHKVEQGVQEERSSLDKLRMQRQELVVRARTLEEQMREASYDRSDLEEKLPEEANLDEWQQKVETIGTRIQRLGPINLAAIEEFKEQSERMEYLQKQHDDVISALETLEDAIRKIDRETRTRFKDTFEMVNSGFKELFPILFGGGQAVLELTGEDLLDTGVSVMARPPGKRNSSIHLLSGGEKALTAVALVFAIFRLNPAPFCMLDEVDAPLDDANVGRFCDMVRHMSETVQFIFITHNKITMELANQLQGVTMHEPGVSRLVSVDVEEAAQMAAM